MNGVHIAGRYGSLSDVRMDTNMKTTTALLLCLTLTACSENGPPVCGDLDANTPTATLVSGGPCAAPDAEELEAVFLDTGLACAVRDLDGATFETECESSTGVIWEWRGAMLCDESGWTAIAQRRTLADGVVCSAEYRLTVPR